LVEEEEEEELICDQKHAIGRRGGGSGFQVCMGMGGDKRETVWRPRQI